MTKIDVDKTIAWGNHLNNTSRRADLYNKAFPARPPLVFGGSSGMVVGTWMIGACYKNPNNLYGAYPHGYLERVHAMFPDARRILHVFSGGLKVQEAGELAWPGLSESILTIQETTGINAGIILADQGYNINLVDIHGPDQGRYPTWQGDVLDMPEEWAERFDLVLADPPYSTADAVKYDCPPPNRGKIMRALRKVTAKAGNLVWLDQVWPMHRKAEWKTWGTIGLIRSTNHRVRVVSIFQAV